MGVFELLRKWRVTHFAFVSDLGVDAPEYSFEVCACVPILKIVGTTAPYRVLSVA